MDSPTGSSRRAMLAALSGAAALSLAATPARAKKKGKKPKPPIAVCIVDVLYVQSTEINGEVYLESGWRVRGRDLRATGAAIDSSVATFVLPEQFTHVPKAIRTQIATEVLGEPATAEARIQMLIG